MITSGPTLLILEIQRRKITLILTNLTCLVNYSIYLVISLGSSSTLIDKINRNIQNDVQIKIEQTCKEMDDILKSYEVVDEKKNQIDPLNYINPDFVRENKKQNVLYIRGLNNNELTWV